MSGEYKIEKTGYPEIDKLARLYNICFGRAIDASFFRWKYFDNPAGKALCIAAKYQEDIVGSCVMMPEEFSIFGEKKKIHKCVDLMVRADHRKMGLAGKLISSSVENLRQSGPVFLYTLPGMNSKLLFLKNKWSKLDDIRACFKHRACIKIRFLLNKLDKLYQNGALRAINSISDLCRDYKFEVPRNKINIIKSEQYLKWRTGDPRHTYHISGYYEDGRIKGYVIYNMGIGDDAYIIDAEAGNNPKIMSALLAAVELAALKNNRRAVVALAARSSVLYKALRKNSYISNSFQRGPLASLLDLHILIDEPRGDAVLNKSNWDIYSMHYDDV